MILKTLELRKFFSNASTIKSNGLMPILDFVRVDNNKIIKTNLNAYIIMDITPTNETLLIDEKILNAIVKVTTSDTINVTAKGDKVIISDGVNKMSFLLSAEEHYPEFPDSEKEGEVVLPKPVLDAIGMAAKNVSVNNVAVSFNYVNVAHGYVAGSDQVRLYTHSFNNLPTLLIDTLAANIISQFGEVKYYQRGNYDFFHVGSFLFGFIKSVGTPIDFNPFLSEAQKEEYVELFTHEIYNFNDIFMASSGSAEVTFNFKDDKLSFHDVDRSVSNEITLSMEGNHKPNISFLPRNLTSILKSIGSEKIRMSPLKNNPGVSFWNEEDEGLMAFLGSAKSL